MDIYDYLWTAKCQGAGPETKIYALCKTGQRFRPIVLRSIYDFEPAGPLFRPVVCLWAVDVERAPCWNGAPMRLCQLAAIGRGMGAKTEILVQPDTLCRNFFSTKFVMYDKANDRALFTGDAKEERPAGFRCLEVFNAEGATEWQKYRDQSEQLQKAEAEAREQAQKQLAVAVQGVPDTPQSQKAINEAMERLVQQAQQAMKPLDLVPTGFVAAGGSQQAAQQQQPAAPAYPQRSPLLDKRRRNPYAQPYRRGGNGGR